MQLLEILSVLICIKETCAALEQLQFEQYSIVTFTPMYICVQNNNIISDSLAGSFKL